MLGDSVLGPKEESARKPFHPASPDLGILKNTFSETPSGGP